MANDFPIQYYTGKEIGPMNELYVPDATNGAAIVNGSLVFQASDSEIELCGADPASILGIAEAKFADKFLWALNGGSGRIPVSVLTSGVKIGLCIAAGTLAVTDEGVAYGVAKLASGNWGIDLTDTSATRVVVVKADVTNQIAWVHFLAANLQADAIAS